MLPQYHRRHLRKAATYSEDEADGGHAGGGHDFGTVGDQVEEDRHGGLCRVVEPAAEHRRQVTGDRRAEKHQPAMRLVLVLVHRYDSKLEHVSRGGE